MMFESLKHPDTTIPEANWKHAQRALHIELWESMDYYFTAIEQNITPGGLFEQPTRWTKRSTLISALAGDVIDSTSVVSHLDSQNTSDSEEQHDHSSSKKPHKHTSIADRVVKNDRTYTWLHALDRRQHMLNTRMSKGKGKKVPKSPEVLDDNSLHMRYFKPKLTSKPVNLTFYSQILDALPEPFPLVLDFASSDTELLTTLLKDAKLYAKSTLQLVKPSPAMKLIIRTPVPWADFAGNGPQDLVKVWQPAALLEHSAITLYRKDFIAAPVGGYIRQVLEQALAKYMPGNDPVFDWPDGFHNDNDIDPFPNPNTPLAQMDIEVSRYRRNAHEEVKRVMARVQNSFVTTIPPTQQTLSTQVVPLSTITSDVDLALQTLYLVSCSYFS